MGKDKETKINKSEKEKERKKKFSEPELFVYDNLSDITLFTTASNATGTSFF
ncbi:MAG: hypothetical protein HZA77_00320 [Candidatus Schekmanbacteria bacterium]|nr:hypothetical protein [Candidatus Schekmanbacteria bacterium]